MFLDDIVDSVKDAAGTASKLRLEDVSTVLDQFENITMKGLGALILPVDGMAASENAKLHRALVHFM